MRFTSINRAVEKGFGAFQNVSGGTLSGNYPVCFTTTAASLDGRGGVAPATSQVKTFAGIIDRDVADTVYGTYQSYGYRSSVRIFATGTSGTIAVDVAMGPAAGSNGVNSTGVVGVYGPVVSMEAIGAAINSPGGFAKAFIRAM